MKIHCLACFLLLILAARTYSATNYVDAGGTNPISPFTAWSTAATNIQDAVTAATTNDRILVTNGVYMYGGVYDTGSNRVSVNKTLTLQSVNGPLVTSIVGVQVPGTNNNGSALVRC